MSYKFISSKCSLDKFASYEEYRENETLHFNIDFMNGVHREYVCSFVAMNSLPDIRAVSCVDQPPSKRQRFFRPSQERASHVAGPSHIQSSNHRNLHQGLCTALWIRQSVPRTFLRQGVVHGGRRNIKIRSRQSKRKDI